MMQPLSRGAAQPHPGAVRKMFATISKRRIPFRIANRWARAPQHSLVWTLAKYLYRRPSDFFRYLGFFPLPVQPVSYREFEYREFAPVRLFPMSDVPASINPANEWTRWTSELPEHLRDHAIASCHTVVVPNGFADAVGNVFSKEGYLVTGASLAVRKDLNHYYLPSSFRPRVYHGANVGVVTSSLQDNYYHWLTGVLPRIHMLRCQGFETDALFIRTSQPFQRETLEALGLPSDHLLDPKDHEFVSGIRLVVPFHDVGSTVEHPKWASDFLRRTFLPPARRSMTGDSATRLYISRDSARWRRVINEQEVMDVLAPLGFRRVILDGLTVVEQATLFRDAEIVVAPHGAALAKLMFCVPGTKVIEFQPSKLQSSFFRLSRSVGLDYCYLTSSTGPPTPVNNHQQITIDLTELRKTLQLASITRSALQDSRSQHCS
jgi:hypothetical protein